MMFRIYSKQNNFNKLVSYLVPLRSKLEKALTPECFSQYHFCTTVNKRTVKPKSNSLEFTSDEKIKILQVLNNDSDNSLERLNIPSMQVKKLKVWKSKKGSFNSINDVLDTEGIDVKHLIKICQSIVMDKPVSSNRKANSLKNRQLISPVLSTDFIESLTSVVGLHLGPAGISWAHISSSVKKLNHWGSKQFDDLPMKISPWENFNLAVQVLHEIPSADVYVFETPPGLGVQPQNQLSAVASYTQHVELTSMLLALLNTSKNHNKRTENEKKLYENVVFYLKAKLAARLFKTWVGTESVSTITTVQQMFGYDKFDLPCSPTQIEQTMITMFDRQQPGNKELLGQSLLLTTAFLDLCVYKNPVSLKALTSSNKIK